MHVARYLYPIPPFIRIYLILYCLNLFTIGGFGDKLISSSLDANWVHTSLIAEASEFLANDNTNNDKAFWELIDKLSDDNEAKYEETNQESEFGRAMALATPFLADESSSIPLLRFALSLRLYSPRVELHRQIARDLLPSLIASNCPQNEAFYQINDRISCESMEIEQLLENANNGESSEPIYSIDHIFPSTTSSNELPFVIFYADLSKPTTFGEFHKNLKQLANEGRIRYIFRHFDGKDSTSLSNPLPLVSLSGYGVELAIKSTEYKAIDDSNAKNKNEEDEAPTNLHGFNFQTLRDKYVHLRDQLLQFQMHLSELDELAPLKQWEIADIGMQASQRVMEVSPEEAIPLLVDLAQNFPIRARSLAQTKVRQSFREEISMNQQQWSQELEIAEGESSIWINGIPVAPDIESLDIFQLFQILRQEQRLAHKFMELGFKREYQSILQIMDLSEEKPGTWALDFRDGKPEWINNLDKDKQYSDWGNSVRLLLQPYFPGMIRPIARNLFTLVCIMDPAGSESKNVLKTAFSFYSHNVPLRIGFIFAVNDSASANGLNDLGVALYNIFQFVKTEKNPAKAIHFLQKIYDELGDSLDLKGVHRVFKRHYTDQEIDEVFGSNSDYGSGRQEGMSFYQKSGLQKLPTILLNGVPLEQSAIDSPERFEEGVILAVMRQTNAMQRAVASGKLTDRENVQNWIMSQPDVLTRLNARLLGSGGKEANKKENKIVKMKHRAVLNEKCDAGDEISDDELGICILKRQRYLTRSDESEKSEEPFWLTIWIVADFDTEKGQKLLQNGLKALKKSNNMRLGIVHNGNEEKEDRGRITISMIIDSILRRLSSTAAKQTLNKLFGAIENEKALFDKEGLKEILDKIAGHGVNMEPILTELSNGNVRQRLKMQSTFARRVLSLAKRQNAIMANGLVYGPLDVEEQFEAEDFGLIEKLAERRGAKKVAAFVKEWQKGEMKAEKNSPSADLVFGILSAVQNYAVPKKRQTVEIVMEFESVLNLLAEDDGRPVLEITAIIDPLSRAAQKLAPILQILLKVLNADLRLAMNPKQRLSELPIKRFYRYVLREEPAFGPTGHLLENVAQFQNLPQKQLLTMNLIVPDAWMVQPIHAEIDLDNIRVAMASKDIFAKFQLRQILLDGHCFDEQTGNPPRGLQFVLGTKADGAMFDTIVMANLGYFQLKAAPGAWILRLREGKSKEIYELKGSADAEKQMEDRGKENEELEELRVLIDSFSGKTIRMRVSKRKGMEKRNLLTEEEGKEGENAFEEEDDAGEESIWSNLAPKKVVKKLSSKIMGGEKHEVINIFSLASGHLYERFLRIMMLSVLKNTKHPVKFWLLNNYLSPQFRESLPILAQNYGFDYQLIEYKWPRWLHQQTEKQRVMWGYKILFLDVLFPLDVKKIIFVDADQVVRTDMMELMEYDLKGAPYGYTPFCESRTSMDGFRFWKSGYWASHLAGRKYHISALYVVDLAKFRQIAAGDRLRGQYQGLSADPNSLANLDQDLPNNMIHQVRIHSLPQEWLWCETWCDDASKENAKTIDLCNNPQTKEPKLDSAMRILPEWVEYDGEIRRILEGTKNDEDRRDVDMRRQKGGDEHEEL